MSIINLYAAANTQYPVTYDWSPTASGEPVSFSPTLIVWPNDDGTMTYIIGIGFTPELGGIVTAIEHRSADGSILYGDVTGLGSPLVSIEAALSDPDEEAFFRYIFAGNDFATSAYSGAVDFNGYAGNDTMSGGSGADYANGGDGNDSLAGNGGADELSGGNGNDTLDGGIGDDSLFGDAGNDWLRGRTGSDVLDGGTGLDWADYISSATPLTVDLSNAANNTGDAFGDTFTSMENIRGGNFADMLIGSVASNYLRGGVGADTLNGGAGEDFADYFGSTTTLTIDLLTPSNNTGEAFGDVYISIERIRGGALADQIFGNDNGNQLEGGLGGDLLNGRGGLDYALYFSAQSAVVANLANPSANMGEAVNDTYTSIEGLIGSSFDDQLIGDGNSNRLDGYVGADTLDGGDGFDYARYQSMFALAVGDPTGVTVDLANTALNTGDAAGDVYVSIEGLIGSGFNDVLVGDAGNNGFLGQDGNDTLDGGAGNDTLNGEDGVDCINGGAGDDVILYNAADNLAAVLGGADTDTLVFNSGTAPTAFDLTAHQFEKAEGRFADTGSNAWASYVDNYNTNWQRTHQTGVMDDGRTYFEDYDEAATETWVRITYFNDALGRSDVESGELDDGRIYNSDLDNGNLYTWSRLDYWFDAFGRADVESGALDDGRQYSSDLDNGNLYSWTRLDYWADALGRSDVETGFLDDGRTYSSDLDNGDAFAWFRIDDWADSLARPDYQNGIYDADDATRPGWTWQVDYDQANEFSWSRVERFWNASGVLQSETFF